MKCIFGLIIVLIIFKHTKYTIRKNCVNICARHGRGAIEICLSEKGALAKRDWEPLFYNETLQVYLNRCFTIASEMFKSSIIGIPFLHMCATHFIENARSFVKK